MNDGIEDGDSGDIYDKFFGIYDPRKVFAVEFFAWLLAQGIETDFNDDQSTNNFFLRVDKLQNDACWRSYKKEFEETRKTDRRKGNRNARIAYINMIKNNDKKFVSHTLEYIEHLENKLIPMTSFDKSLWKRFITNIRAISDQKDASKWTLTDKNNIEIDIVKTICQSITEEMIMNLEYNNPLLSYVLHTIKFYRDIDPTLEKYFVNLYENQQVCEKLFPQVSDASSLFLEQFEMWNSNNFNKDFMTTFNEGTWEHFALHPIFDILTLRLDKCVLRWGESTSSASKYRKTENIKFEKETREHLDRIIALFLMSSQAKKADNWIEMMIAKNLYEIVYNDKRKLIRFGHDSKNKMLDELIEKKYIYLSDWKNLCNDICKVELLLFQAYGNWVLYVSLVSNPVPIGLIFGITKHICFNILEAKLKVSVLDCPAHPFCHVQELFDLDIPYKKVVIEEFKLFIQALWAIRCALSDIIHDYEKTVKRL
ncbi:28851_t:CDS:2 [Dentiscutata erythropus]|uniref:28851_t:CDS:1 n=1 Tax=Dentiscutata erythropus TaxID=1348616 RepID=A0A9N9JKD4_9GLOM|nr:28851_t:CDS:2 [Dentiscutata erythropus]